MRVIDVHAHVLPKSFIRAAEAGKDWHGIKTSSIRLSPKFMWSTEQRISEMDDLNVDVQVLSSHPLFYSYNKDAELGKDIARDCNDHIAQAVKAYPKRFAGFCALPMQDISSAIAELERAVIELGLKGAMIDDVVNERTYDSQEFLPFFQAAEQMGALIFIHQGSPTIVGLRTTKYALPITVGGPADRTLTFASLVFGGVMDKCPNLKICLAHGGGYTCFGIGRMDLGWKVRPEARANISRPPSAYLHRFYYDSITNSEENLRYIIDSVGIERIFFGTEWPSDLCDDSPVEWLLGLKNLSQDEKEAILWKNLERVLGI